jgi:hypothetical protein
MIPYDPNNSLDDLTLRVQNAIAELIEQEKNFETAVEANSYAGKS